MDKAPIASIEDVNLHQELSPLVEDLSTRAGFANTELSVKVPNRPIPIVEIEALKIAVREAVENASNHAAASEIRIGYQSTQSGYQVTVSDNGKGIPKETQDTLLSLFNADERDPHISGAGNLGIGFALIKRAAESAGGSLRIQSSPQSGTNLMLSYSLLEDAIAPVVGNEKAGFGRLGHYFSAYTGWISGAFLVFPMREVKHR